MDNHQAKRVVFFIALWALKHFADALVVKCLWGWIISPVFDVDPLLYLEALGLTLILMLLLPRNSNKDIEGVALSDALADTLAGISVNFILYVGVGYVIALLMA